MLCIFDKLFIRGTLLGEPYALATIRLHGGAQPQGPWVHLRKWACGLASSSTSRSAGTAASSGGIAAYARHKPDWKLLLRPDASSLSWTDALLSEFDGLIARVRDPGLDQWLADRGAIAVNVSDRLAFKRLPFVGVDAQRVGEVAADYLLGLGYSHFGFYGFNGFHVQVRLQGFKRRLHAARADPQRHRQR